MPATLIPVTDPSDPRIAAYRDIRERDLVSREGLFVAEGKVVLNVLFSQSRFEAVSVLLLENRVDGMADLLSRIPGDVPVYVAGSPVIDAIAGFPMHRGVLAMGRRRAPEQPAAFIDGLGDGALVLALIGISNHDNVGSIFRNAAAFGADAILLDDTSCDPLYRKAIRVSVGAVLKVPFVRGGDAAAIGRLLQGRNYRQYALSPSGGRDIADIRRSGPTALFLGSEGHGLPQEIMKRIETVRIAMADGFDSLNVAAASAVALHRLRDARA